MSIQPQYLTYNRVSVKIITNNDIYTVSNILKTGFPDNKCECHLESITINEAIFGNSSNAINTGATGTVSCIDYASTIFNLLVKHYKAFSGSNTDNDKLLPHIQISIDCFTGHRSFNGYIKEWNMSFTGGIPNIQLTWQAMPLTGAITKGQDSAFNTPAELIEFIKKENKLTDDNNIPFVDFDGNDVANRLKFLSTPTYYNIKSKKSTGNCLIDAYEFIVAYSVFTDDDKKPLIFKYDTDTQLPKFKVASYPPDKQYENEFGNTCKQLIFVHNGSYKPYSVNKDKKYVIPIFNLNYKIDYKGLWTNFKILKNPNGTLVIDNTSNGSSTIVNPDVATTQENYTSSNSNTITFSCYNVMSFDLFNMYSKIEYDVYDELGRKHTMSGIGTVNSCNYTITNNVVKADVTITELYNQNDGESTGSANSEAITMPVQQ